MRESNAIVKLMDVMLPSVDSIENCQKMFKRTLFHLDHKLNKTHLLTYLDLSA